MKADEYKQAINDEIQEFNNLNFPDQAISLLSALGYRSNRSQKFNISSSNITELFPTELEFNHEKALSEDWASIDFLFQLTGDELANTSQGRLNFDGNTEYNPNIYQSYLFFAIELSQEKYTRTQLSLITREINKLFLIPVMILFKYGSTFTIAIINRRPHKRDEQKDVLEKVTLIKDINTQSPHRAHIEILYDLSLEQLHQKYSIGNFLDLHKAWQSSLDASELNKRFFSELANWYFWAVENVKFPKGAGKDKEVRNATSVIRLITRLIFIWFIKEKGLVPDILFDQQKLASILNFDDVNNSAYYKAILQNLFFATLNQEMNNGNTGKRKFRRTSEGSRDSHYMIHNVYRYNRYFKNADEALDLFAPIPFLNGGLFECLDRPDKENPKKIIRIDGFSDRDDNPLTVPDELFFGEEKEVDLNEEYGTSNKRYKVRGLIHILNRYKFTIEENTPINQEVALDPELLGRVFENLLAAYNPETGTTARKQTGSFYTPREIVNYMVDESLIAYLNTKLSEGSNKGAANAEKEERLRQLFTYNELPHEFSNDEVNLLINAIDNVNVLDPAVGSGAFPMGVLQKFVHVLSKLDPGNQRWKERQIEKANEIPDSTIRKTVLDDIENAFTDNELNYGRKLYLIENCIYGVDIQPIAIQIAKLRFFISLVVDQIVNKNKQNLGIRPLPNLETKFVAANSLIIIEKPQQMMMRNPLIGEKEKELEESRKKHFSARTLKTKRKYQDLDQNLRAEVGDLLNQDGWPSETTEVLISWDPYDSNTSASFFDKEWMFGLDKGFDIVIGNPPYISALDFSLIYENGFRDTLNSNYQSAHGSYDIYVIFMEMGIESLSSKGILAYITPNKYLSAKYASKLREFILKNTLINNIVDLSTINVFVETAVYPIISIFQKKQSSEPTHVKILLPKKEDSTDLLNYQESFIPTKHLNLLPENIWGFLLSDKYWLLEKTIKDTKQLSAIGSVNATSTAGEAEGYGKYITNKNLDNALKLINTGTIDKFTTTWGKKELTHSRKKFLTPYLPLNQANVNSRRRRIYKSPKIIFAKLAKECEAFLDIDGSYASINTNCFYNPKDNIPLEYVCAYCNSNVFMFLYNQLFGSLRMGGGYYQFQAPQLRVMPIKIGTQKQINKVVDLANRVIETIGQRDTSNLLAMLNGLFYEIFELDEREIDVVKSVVL